jgi:hypothetical protein
MPDTQDGDFINARVLSEQSMASTDMFFRSITMSRFEHLSIIKATRSTIYCEHDLAEMMLLLMSAIASGN